MSTTPDILDRLVGFDTVSARSNLELIDWVQARLAARGFAVTRLDDPDAPKAGLMARIGPPEGAGLVLSAHSDVVPVDGQDWTRPPFRLTREGGRLFGRGTTDMKGFLAAMLSLADRLEPRRLRAPLILVISYDEEVGCVGIARMRDRLQPLLGAPRLCVVGEPTGMQIATGHKGKMALRAVTTGEAGHSALAPRFANALHPAADVVLGLRALQDDLARQGARDAAFEVPYSTVHAGMISGGRALNIVPDRAEVVFELRHLAGDDPAALCARIDAMAAGIAGGPVHIERLGGYPALDTDPGAAAVDVLRTALPDARLTKVAFGTEAGVFADMGVPSLVCGPGFMAEQGHKPDEYIAEEQLALCDGFLDRLLDGLA